ncbi:hypothetical protein ABIA32_004345 [Streptacidiphilus sp. MAP12-20]|uniref:SCO6745 family protein n=1 Tax=Streptacidiphilus sp. MAP12-20 TaxID=3156299 RepID=UPI003513280E
MSVQETLKGSYGSSRSGSIWYRDRASAATDTLVSGLPQGAYRINAAYLAARTDPGGTVARAFPAATDSFGIMTTTAARTLWLRTEPLHAVVYFDDECRKLGKAMGLRGFWMGYFPTRLAPLGPVGPAVAEAVLGVFAPGMLARALPAAWEIVSPGEALDWRARYTADALRRVLPDADEVAAAVAGPLGAVVADAPALARPLFAANRELCGRRADPVEELWQLVTCLREFRGDAHVAVLADHELDAPEALVLAAATGRVPGEGMRMDRGWTEEEWADAGERLRSRGLLDTRGAVTDRGREERERIEEATDRLAARLLRPLAEGQLEALLGALAEPARRLRKAGIPPEINPIGLPQGH